MTKRQYRAPALDLDLNTAKRIVEYVEVVFNTKLNDSMYAEVVHEIKMMIQTS